MRNMASTMLAELEKKVNIQEEKFTNFEVCTLMIDRLFIQLLKLSIFMNTMTLKVFCSELLFRRNHAYWVKM